ncbi:TPA: aminomethyl-transferring glycine dehydrogenase [Candidatus Poribacteria bacterium]|nr:aminomethyl-transferring glycine dehydrogenase [Candidatus Poribacteria bacterium]HIC01276.1 aminomethyl-transferring glycine dehydrogenase [Candidatus Poribacteria bacterium]HIN30147.1 glycine dehydrogenase (aminomethyl-transferring) [Candidatus Poribacteria bacterium]HIO50280.1 glycine dehydrogenase (aminomethyl-transferring) [Candidatus Poribacteria bacterium]HIO80283.1 glycine dehydrogenase (aminomethyl-transferring) [Candidatus Poribacteria bacterium]
MSDLHRKDLFVNRHLGPRVEELKSMLKTVGYGSIDALIKDVVPERIRDIQPLKFDQAWTEFDVLNKLKKIASKNDLYRSFIGMGYYNCITPLVIQRNILENPSWYTAYTPYQAEVAQGRLEALLNFQTMIIDLTGLPIANASLLDEGTAAAEAMAMCLSVAKPDVNRIFFVSETCHPQTIEVVRTRAEPLDIELIISDHQTITFDQTILGAIVQYPTTDGVVHDYGEFAEKVHAASGLLVVAADLLSLALLKPPGEFDADIAVGSTQRFGVPMGYGGPHAAYFSTKEKFKRKAPGRIVGLSQDTEGSPAIRLALQTREQHIRREKATSNICTAQVLLAVMASMYAIYHGPEGIRHIAKRIHALTHLLREGLKLLNYSLSADHFFDTISINLGSVDLNSLLSVAQQKKINLRIFNSDRVGISLDETASVQDVQDLLQVFSINQELSFDFDRLTDGIIESYPSDFGKLQRESSYLTHPVFNTYHSETEMLRYIHQLQEKDLSLANSMIPLGSCTMKLNATAEMVPVTWPEFSQLHPFAPIEQTEGYQLLFDQLESWLSHITGFDGVSLQPNAGSQGEYAGLLVIRQYHRSRGEGHRNVCLIPKSAHGTNPASAVMAGMHVIVVDCDTEGNVDLTDLQRKSQEYKQNLAAMMITYPSTHGVFEEGISEICQIIHQHGGQVYMDGANLNAMIGLCRPGDFGPDVCHLNLHKTFCIPHGGGGPGMGPIAVNEHLIPFLPTHPIVSKQKDSYTIEHTLTYDLQEADGIGPVSSAPWGSANILPISWAYIAMMGSDGLKQATEIAILNANYIAKCLDPYYSVVYKGQHGLVAHECIIDLRNFKKTSGIDVSDVAKRLMDYGFHAPTVSWPIPGTMMIEPTESESKAELDRFCDAMIEIRKEIADIENGESDRNDNVLKNAPHTALQVTTTEWLHPYSRQKAAFPMPWIGNRKYWPPVARINEAYGDRNLVCACPPLDSYSSE